MTGLLHTMTKEMRLIRASALEMQLEKHLPEEIAGNPGRASA